MAAQRSPVLSTHNSLALQLLMVLPARGSDATPRPRGFIQGPLVAFGLGCLVSSSQPVKTVKTRLDSAILALFRVAPWLVCLA